MMYIPPVCKVKMITIGGCVEHCTFHIDNVLLSLLLLVRTMHLSYSVRLVLYYNSIVQVLSNSWKGTMGDVACCERCLVGYESRRIVKTNCTVLS